MWYACAWWAIRRFLVGRGLVVGQIRKLESLLRQLLGVLEGRGWLLLGLLRLALVEGEQLRLWRLAELEDGRL